MRPLLFCLAALGVVACEVATDPNGELQPPGTIWGTYGLASVNGKPLPYTQATGSMTMIVEGTVSLNQNGTFVRSTTYSFITGSVTTSDIVVLSGQYTNTEGNLTMTNGELTIPATAYRNTLTLNPVGAETYVYRR